MCSEGLVCYGFLRDWFLTDWSVKNPAPTRVLREAWVVKAYLMASRHAASLTCVNFGPIFFSLVSLLPHFLPTHSRPCLSASGSILASFRFCEFYQCTKGQHGHTKHNTKEKERQSAVLFILQQKRNGFETLVVLSSSLLSSSPKCSHHCKRIGLA
jgi:hypothetical protein